jgi:hypothetical protein
MTPSKTTSAKTSSMAQLPSACSSQCSPINQALTQCSEDVCFCPTALSAGPSCSQCLVGLYPASATALGSAMSICQTEFPTTTRPYTTDSIPTYLSSPSSSPVTTSSSPGGLSGGAIGGIAGGVIGGILIIGLAVILCLRRRSAGTQNNVGYQPAPMTPMTPMVPAYQPSPTVSKFAEAGEKPSEYETTTSARLRYPEADYQLDSVGEFGGRTGGNY